MSIVSGMLELSLGSSQGCSPKDDTFFRLSDTLETVNEPGRWEMQSFLRQSRNLGQYLGKSSRHSVGSLIEETVNPRLPNFPVRRLYVAVHVTDLLINILGKPLGFWLGGFLIGWGNEEMRKWGNGDSLFLSLDIIRICAMCLYAHYAHIHPCAVYARVHAHTLRACIYTRIRVKGSERLLKGLGNVLRKRYGYSLVFSS